MDTENKELIEVNNIVDEVERLPHEQCQVVLQKLEIYQGDLPHPDILKGYQELYPVVIMAFAPNLPQKTYFFIFFNRFSFYKNHK